MIDSSKLPDLPEYRGRSRRNTLFWIAIFAVFVGIALFEWGPRRLWQAVQHGAQSLWMHIPFLTQSVTVYRDGHRVTLRAHPGWVLALAHAVGPLVLGLIAVSVPVVLILLTLRFLLRQHRSRTMTWWEVVLFQNDVVTPDAMRQLFDQLWDALWPRSRWIGSPFWYPWVVSAPPFSLSLIRDHQVDDQMHWVLGIPAAFQDRVLAAWQNTYQNVRFHPWPHPVQAPRQQVVRWRLKYRTAIRLIDVVSQYKALPLEMLVQSVAREGWRERTQVPDFVWQATWVPVSTGRALKRLETAAQYATWEKNVALEQAADSALDQMGRGRWLTELRASAPDYDTMQRMVSAWGVQNRWAILRPHSVVVWRQKWVTWMQHGLPRLWPLAGGNALWSGECATFFALPTGRLRVADLPRSMTRRMPASRALSRQPGDVLMLAEGQDRVGLYPQDFTKNLLLLGIQGSGKSTSLINVFKNSVRATRADGTPLNAVVLFDIGKDTAQAALRLVPPDRTVIWFDPTDPTNPWALEPLDTTVGDAAAMTQLVDTLQDIFGADAIGPRSREILGHTLTIILADSTPDHPRTLRDAYRFLTDEGYRMGFLSQALKNPALPRQTRDFWTVVLPNLLSNNPRFWEEAVAAPRNKLDELLRHGAVEQALGVQEPGHPRKRAINWDRVIAERQVVIINLDMARLGGRSPVRLFGILITQLLWRAIQRQGLKAETDRIPVRLLYDEAQEYLSAQFLNMLALGRAYGFQTVLATRFLLELKDPALQAGIVNLCQNRIIHRIPEPAEAVKLMQQMMTVYINNITLQEEAQNLERFMADDIMRLPDHTAICVWQAKGAVQAPFIGNTIDWRPEAHEDWAQYHLTHQPEWLPALSMEPDPLTPTTPPDAPPASETQSDDTLVPTPANALEETDEEAMPPIPEPIQAKPPATPLRPNPTISVADMSERYGLSQTLITRICSTLGCQLDELAAVLQAHADERPLYNMQYIAWLQSHPEWFASFASSQEHNSVAQHLPSSTDSPPLTPDDSFATPWLIDQ